jgi:hypothetical protein
VDVPVLPSIDILILSAPFLLFLALGMLGLDTHIASPTRGSTTRRFFCEADGNGIPHLSDPDGRTWQPLATTRTGQKPSCSPCIDSSRGPSCAVAAARAKQPRHLLILSYRIEDK